MHDIEYLVKMANQLADNFAFHEDCENRLRDHLQRFWAPSMRRALAEHAAAGGEGLKPPLREVLGTLDAG